MGGLEGRVGVPALQPVPCLSGSCMGGEGMDALYIKYTWSIGNCATWCTIPAPSSCRSLVAFNVYDFSFQGFIVPFLHNIVGGNKNEMLLFPLCAVKCYILRMQPFRPSYRNFFLSIGIVKKKKKKKKKERDN